MYQQQDSMSGGMGAACQDGYYEAEVFGIKTGQCIPNLKTLAQGAATGATGAVTTGVANSSATKAAITNAAGNALGTKIINFYKDKPAIAYGVTAAVVLLVVYGGMSFVRGK